MRDFWVTIPIFGLVHYVEQPAPPESEPTIGYVDYGRPQLASGIYMKGEWRDHRGRRVKETPVSWFRGEKPDGTPIF